jgi:hypothetical protein
MMSDSKDGVTTALGRSALQVDAPEGTAESLPPSFDGLQYIASHGDLVRALGADRAAGTEHYLQFGEAEGRRIDTFDEAQYLENYPDLQAAFGEDTEAATVHYIQQGHAEGRSDVDGLQYIASHGDLIQALGADEAAGLQHYVELGRAERREQDTFDEAQYLANNEDLRAAFGDDGDAATAHYIQFGFAEGRIDDELPEGFDGLRYIASNPDLIAALGADALAGQRHYAAFGAAEDRETDDFDAEQYLANYPDLQEAFDDDGDAATAHYIRFGFDEDRSDEPIPNGAPVFTSSATPSVAENTTAVVALEADDPDGDEVAFTVTGGVDRALFGIEDDQLALRDLPDFEEPGDQDGSNQYQVVVTADDGKGGTTVQPLTVTVSDANDAPVAVDDTGAEATLGGAAITIDVLANDTDADEGDQEQLTVASVTGLEAGEGTAAPGTGNANVAYTPPPEFDGEQVTFDYTVRDADGATDAATVTVTLAAPVAPADFLF